MCQLYENESCSKYVKLYHYIPYLIFGHKYSDLEIVLLYCDICHKYYIRHGNFTNMDKIEFSAFRLNYHDCQQNLNNSYSNPPFGGGNVFLIKQIVYRH